MDTTTQPSPPPAAASAARPLPHDEVIVIVDFGSQTAQLIARRVREAGAYSHLVSPRPGQGGSAAEIAALKPKGIILSGGPASVYEPGAPTMDPGLLTLGVPVLGICYGMQLAAKLMGARVERAARREFGRAGLAITDRSDLLAAIPEKTTVWMSHGDQVSSFEGLDATVETLATTPTCPYAAVRVRESSKAAKQQSSTSEPRDAAPSTQHSAPSTQHSPFYGVQFHPEVTHTPHGVDMLQNFLYEICGCTGSWKMSGFLEHEIARVREITGADERGEGGADVICGLSGGVDSSVCAALLHKAIAGKLHCIFIDTGMLRKAERGLVETTFRDHFDIDLTVIDASQRFLADLKGITDPQEKRRLIGHRFVREFEAAAKALPHGRGAAFLAQGTLYPDVIESGPPPGTGHAGHSANIKLHHNVGGLPEKHGFKILEPLRDLFKDEVRKLGEVLGLPDQIVWRHPFPGPGLAVRILGEITQEKLDLVREADEILLEEIVAANLYRSLSQVFAVLLPVQSVGVMGDSRTYEQAIAIRAVETQDFMTADWAKIPYAVLAQISSRIINEVRGVNRVVYDISSKPPATIEWE